MTSAGSRLFTRTERGAGSYRPTRALRFALTADAVERFAGAAPIRILDAGCGEGLLAVTLARAHPSWTIEGADLDPAGLERGEQRAREAGVSNVRLRRLELSRDLGNATYDAVLAIECLTEIPDADAALDGLTASVRPGGLFVAHVPERSWRPVLHSSDATWRHELRHGYDPRQLRTMLEARGLKVVAIRTTTHAGVHLAQEVRDRLKDARLKARLAVYPLLRAAVALERAGLHTGEGRGLFVEAHRP